MNRSAAASSARRTGALASLKRRIKTLPFAPRNWLPSFRAAQVLWNQYGHVKSVRCCESIDRDGRPLPWYTYPAIDFLHQLDFSGKDVFEFGSGMSTLFWSRSARRVVSVEDDESWFERVSARSPANAVVILETDLATYPDTLDRTGQTFDVIVVDGPARGRTRLKCCRAALKALRPGGMIILDNSDWLPQSSRLLRESGLLEVDMTGFAPIAGHVQTTSFYFDRAFAIPPRAERQPMPGVGHVNMDWEQPVVQAPGGIVEFDDEVFRGVADDRPFCLRTATGLRRFRALTYLGYDDVRHIAILDLDDRRVLLSRHRPAAPRRRDPDLAAEIARIAQLPWDAFRAFVNGHDSRRRVLDAAGHLTRNAATTGR